MGEVYTSRLAKGGAALEDTRRVVELWDAELSPEENPRRLSSENLLGKPEHSERQARLDALTTDWFQRTGDSWAERSDLPYR